MVVALQSQSASASATLITTDEIGAGTSVPGYVSSMRLFVTLGQVALS